MRDLTRRVVEEAADGIDSVCTLTVRSYPGRGMYGKECLAVTGDHVGDLLTLGMSIAYLIALSADTEELDDATDAIDDAIGNSRPSIDSLGRGFVAYWPSIPFETEA